MRILRDGPSGKEWKLEMECPSCHSLLEVEESDLRPMSMGEALGFRRGSTEYVCTCIKPRCGAVIPIRYDQLPPKLKKTLDDLTSPELNLPFRD